MGKSAKSGWTIGQYIMVGFMAVTMIGAPILWWLLPDRVTVKMGGEKRWQLEWCGLIGQGERELFVVHTRGVSGGRAPSYNWLAVLDPVSGRVLGDHTSSDALTVQGFDRGRMWVREHGLGRITNDRDFALSLPGLSKIESPGEPPSLKRLFLGNCNSPRPPKKLEGRLVLDGRIICDNRTKRAVDLGGGDRLLSHQTLRGDMGKLILTRLTRDGKVVWSLHEATWAGQRKLEAPGFRVAWASRFGKCVILVMPLDASSGRLRVACLDPQKGKLGWRRGPP